MRKKGGVYAEERGCLCGFCFGKPYFMRVTEAAKSLIYLIYLSGAFAVCGTQTPSYRKTGKMVQWACKEKAFFRCKHRAAELPFTGNIRR